MLTTPHMTQYDLVLILERFMDSAPQTTLTVSVWRSERYYVMNALLYFLADLASPRFPDVVCAWRDHDELELAQHAFDATQSDYAAVWRLQSKTLYQREVLRVAEPPQQAYPDYVRQTHRLLFKRRAYSDLCGGRPVVALYNDLTTDELQAVHRLRPGSKRICVMYNRHQCVDPAQLLARETRADALFWSAEQRAQ